MQGLAEYIICVCAAALLTGIVQSLLPKGTSREILKIVGGLFLAFTVIRPVADLEIPELSEMGMQWQTDAADVVAQGEAIARQAAAESIKQELEAYILDKALSMRLEVTVKLKLEEETLHPSSVTLIAKASPNTKQQMNEWLCRELGLTEEDIKWIS